MRLILVRHGETCWNSERRIQGCRTDSELSEKGKDQAKRIALALRSQNITAIYSSSLKRAMDVAHMVAKTHGLVVNIAPELNEIDAGELEGLSEKDLIEKHGEFWKEWVKCNPSLHAPGGESLKELQKRAWQTIQRLREKHPDEVVAVVSHLFTILTIICQALGLDLRHINHLRQDAAAINILELTRQRNSLLLLNDICHLEIQSM